MPKTLEQALSDRRRTLQNPYAYLPELEEIADLKCSHRRSENPYSHADDLDKLARPLSRFDSLPVESISFCSTRKSDRRSDLEIEQLAREIQLQLWERRADLFPDHKTRKPVDMLDPVAALVMLGFSVDLVGALGQLPGTGKNLSNVAGLIDKRSRQVLISSGLSPAVRNFTAAHELGHAVLHELVGMHRDKPMDGSLSSNDWQEKEAEKFAAFFLMPDKLLRRIFEATFGKTPLVLDENVYFALSGSLPSSGWRPRTLRDFSRVIACAARFNGANITPLMDQFRVSKEAMAIRLEQLGLVA